MLKLILNQTTWGIFGSIFGFAIGFLLKIYLINIVGLESWGKYISAQTLITFIDILISICFILYFNLLIVNILSDI